MADEVGIVTGDDQGDQGKTRRRYCYYLLTDKILCRCFGAPATLTRRAGFCPDHPAAFTRRERCRAKDTPRPFPF